MKKNTIKAFTLVEMLIVIVIIGILIAALLPRLSSAQAKARDVSRQTALSQLQSAIVMYQGDKGERPQQDLAKQGMAVNVEATTGLALDLVNAGMTSIPQDQLRSNKFYGIGTDEVTGGQFGYIVTARNGTPDGGFVLMAKTETEGNSNWVYCTGTTTDKVVTNGNITNDTDIREIKLCTKVTQGDDCKTNDSDCTYQNDAQLRYIIVY